MSHNTTQNDDETDEEPTKDNLTDAFRTATWGTGAFSETVEIEVHGDDVPSIGTATLSDGASAILNDPDATTLDQALGAHGWESGTVWATADGMVVSVWEADN